MFKVAFSSIYKYGLPDGHRFPMEKYELLPEQLIRENIIQESQLFEPQKLDRSQLLLTHSSDFLDKLDKLQLSRKEVRDIGFPVRKDLIERGKVISHGTYECALHAIQSGGVALNIAGGTHHSFRDRGEGFCIYNDFAIAANLLLKDDIIQKILIVDLDVHQGNGTASIFQEEDRVFTFSMHGERNYPLRKENSDLDIGLPDKSGDQLYLDTLFDTLPRLIEKVEPDLIMYLSGVDIIETDKLGRLSVTKLGCVKRDKFVFDQCHLNKIPVIVSMGGGYSEKLADIVDAHANTFKAAADLYT